jgi:hypothetical protein
MDNPDLLVKYDKLLDLRHTPRLLAGRMTFRGKEVSPEAGMALVHVVDRLEDHFGNENTPSVNFKCDTLVNLGYNPRSFGLVW